MNNKFNITVSGSAIVKFSLNGRLDSNTAQDFLNVIMSNLGDKKESIIVLDCRELVYISSAGLRAMLTIKKRTNSEMVLINLSPEVYEIFDVTGFAQIFDVAQVKEGVLDSEVKELDNIDGEIIGETGGISIYKTKSEQLIKLYPENTQLEDLEKELNYTKAAFVSGIPTLISYYVVKFRERYGLVYEMPNAKTVASIIQLQDWNLGNYAKTMGFALRKIHSCVIENEKIFPKTKSLYSEYLKRASSYYKPEEVVTLAKIINAIPEKNNFIYGNYHAGNVFIQNDEIILLNMSGVSLGNPIFDLAKSYMIYFSETENFAKSLMDIAPDRARMFLHFMLSAYFGSASITPQEMIIKKAADLCTALLPGMGKFSPEQIQKFVAHARAKIFKNSDEYIKTLSQVNF